jgi:hypothetical protein
LTSLLAGTGTDVQSPHDAKEAAVFEAMRRNKSAALSTRLGCGRARGRIGERR